MSLNCYQQNGFEVQQADSASVDNLTIRGESYTPGCFIRIESGVCVKNLQIHSQRRQENAIIQANTIIIGEGTRLEDVCIRLNTFQDTVTPAFNTIRIGRSCGLNNVIVEIQGTHNELSIGNNVHVTDGLGCFLRGAGNSISAASDVSIQQADLIAVEIENQVTIGEDSMLAHGIIMRTSDDHPVYSLTNFERLNPARPVNIGRHVWIGDHALILPGSNIGAGSIVAAHAVITRHLSIPERSRVVGMHSSKVLEHPREDWARDLFFDTTSAQEQRYTQVCAEAHRARAKELMRIGRYQEARTNYERSIELYPHPYACAGLDYVLRMLRQVA